MPFFFFLNCLLFCCFVPSLPITEKFHFHANLHLILCPFLIFIAGSFHKLPFLRIPPWTKFVKAENKYDRGERDVLRGNIAGDIIKWNVFLRFICLLHFDWFFIILSYWTRVSISNVSNTKAIQNKDLKTKYSFCTMAIQCVLSLFKYFWDCPGNFHLFFNSGSILSHERQMKLLHLWNIESYSTTRYEQIFWEISLCFYTNI